MGRCPKDRIQHVGVRIQGLNGFWFLSPDSPPSQDFSAEIDAQNSIVLAHGGKVANTSEQFARLVANECEAHPMDATQVVQISARVGWIIEITRQDNGYRCWVVNRELDVLSDGQVYSTSSAALAAGRSFVERG